MPAATTPLHRRLAVLLLVLTMLVPACGDDAPAEDVSTAEDKDDRLDDGDDDRDQDDRDEDDRDEDEEPSEDPTDEPADQRDPPVKPTQTPLATPAATATPVPAPAVTLPPGGADEVEVMGDDMGAGGATSYDSYVTITDDTGAIQLDVPAEWNQVDGAPYTDDQGRQLFDVRAAADLEAFLQTWDAPGVIVTASTEVAQTENEVTLLDEALEVWSGACTYLGREPYDDGLYTGQFDTFDACGGTDTGYIVLGAVPSSRAFVIRVQVQVVEERDIEALLTALNTFVITGDV